MKLISLFCYNYLRHVYPSIFTLRFVLSQKSLCGNGPENPLIQAGVSTKLPDSKTPFRQNFNLLMIREREVVEGDGLSDSIAVKHVAVEGKARGLEGG